MFGVRETSIAPSLSCHMMPLHDEHYGYNKMMGLHSCLGVLMLANLYYIQLCYKDTFLNGNIIQQFKVVQPYWRQLQNIFWEKGIWHPIRSSETVEYIKNNTWVAVNNNFWVTSEAICQWFSRVTKSRVKIIGKTHHEWPKNRYSR